MPQELAPYWTAFAMLSRDRPASGLEGPAAIPWTAMDAYARRFGIKRVDDFNLFARLVIAMDAAYLDQLRLCRARKTETNNGHTQIVRHYR
jgi:hypothetical protein